MIRLPPVVISRDFTGSPQSLRTLRLEAGRQRIEPAAVFGHADAHGASLRDQRLELAGRVAADVARLLDQRLEHAVA